MSTERFAAVLDVFRANYEHGASRDWTLATVYDLVGPKADTATLVLIDRAVRIVFDGACEACIEHPGWRTNDEARLTSGGICRDCLGSGRDQSRPRDDEDRLIPPNVDPEPEPLPDINPVETLASIIAKATVALAALAAEEEGNLRTKAHEIRDLSVDLATLVDRW